jgi:hypothetical protein
MSIIEENAQEIVRLLEPLVGRRLEGAGLVSETEDAAVICLHFHGGRRLKIHIAQDDDGGLGFTGVAVGEARTPKHRKSWIEKLIGR